MANATYPRVIGKPGDPAVTVSRFSSGLKARDLPFAGIIPGPSAARAFGLCSCLPRRWAEKVYEIEADRCEPPVSPT